MNYRELIEDASSQLSTYRSPDIDEAEEFLDQLLKTTGLGSVKYEHIESIDIYGDEVHVETTWSARGCPSNSSYQFPVSLLDAENPLKAAKIWGLKKKIDEETSERNRYASYVSSADERIIKLRIELEAA